MSAADAAEIAAEIAAEAAELIKWYCFGDII